LKLLFVIDHLGLGGAQRQMVDLACGMSRRGHAVEFFVYHPGHDFFAGRVEAAGVVVHKYQKGRGFALGALRKLAALMRGRDFDVILAFLNSPVIYAELARLVAMKPVLVVSERCSHHDDRSIFAGYGRRLLHQAADCVVTNSQTHAEWLRKKWWLSGKVAAIYNGFDLESLKTAVTRPLRPGNIRLLAVGRICPQKNLVNLIEGLRVFHLRNGYVPSVSWVGKRDMDADGSRYGDLVQHTLDKYPEIRAAWNWLGEQRDMRPIFAGHDALVHPSRYEGLPNAVCEALAAGMPTLVSDVCDHSLLVADGTRGFLFDPESAESIAAALQKLTRLSQTEWAAFSRDARIYAEEHLDLERMVCAYEALFIDLIDRQ
jgi:glycosyltransferase involved in cell wall biosynthesis